MQYLPLWILYLIASESFYMSNASIFSLVKINNQTCYFQGACSSMS